MPDEPDVASTDGAIVTAQLDRAPREPWRVSSRCSYGYPTTIASPAILADGDRFPTTFWLTCPFLTKVAAGLESDGATAAWVARIADDPRLAEALRRADAQLRARRAQESGGVDPLEAVGLAGQRDPLGVKCLHAHVAYALVGIDDPIGSSVLEQHGKECSDRYCTRSTEER